MKLSEKKLFLMDMDGTLYLSERLFDGSLDFLRTVRENGGRCVFMTNNSSRGTESYIGKMARLGIETGPEDYLTSADAAISMLDRDDTYYVCGTASLKRQLREAGFDLAEPVGADDPFGRGYDYPDGATEALDGVDALLLGYDTELTYRKLEECCILLGRGVKYFATHPDMVCPTWYGSAPDCGSVIEMLATATGRRPEKIFGKPQPYMPFAAMEKFDCPPEETCLVGDRVYTDIACGVNAGIDTVMVLSGEGTVSDIEKYGVKPTYVMEDIKELYQRIKAGE